jgi:hypothetical protein
MADPNGVRFPYSTYSLTFSLASSVNGWDPEWIAEDWHMGIKCFLLTLGKAEVQPVIIPSLNYAPETDSWWGTVCARYTQAKRHSLGFTDMSYYFMMMPLIYLYLSTEKAQEGRSLAHFWYLYFKGGSRVVRLINSHAIIGFMLAYLLINLALHGAMTLMTPQVRVETFFHLTSYVGFVFALGMFFAGAGMVFNFFAEYTILCDRMEEPVAEGCAPFIVKYRLVHLATIGLSLAVFGPFFFFALALTVWLAAIKMMTAQNFEYEVAAKPTKEMRKNLETS